MHGLNEKIVKQISKIKNEPNWMLQKRLSALKLFKKTPLPSWGPNLKKLNLKKISYYNDPNSKETNSWENVPKNIKKTFDKLGIPESEKKVLAGVGAQWDSSVIYHNLKESLEKQGVIFENMDTAVQKYPELVKKFFMTSNIPINDHKFIMLHAAIWSGGCLTEEAMIFTLNKGLKSIKNINNTDIVHAIDNKGLLKEAKIENKIYNGIKEVYYIRVGGRELEATENHKFLCLEKSKIKLNKHGKKRYKIWKELKDINIGDLIAIPKKLDKLNKKYYFKQPEKYIKNKNLENKILLPIKTNEEIMWLIGLIIGDGNIYHSTKHNCVINLAIPKNNLIREELIITINKTLKYKIKTNNDVSISINSKRFGDYLCLNGIKGKAKTKEIPYWAFNLPLKERLALLGGLLDSDSSIENQGKTIKFELANRKLITQIKLLAISCGLYSDGKIISRTREGNLLKKEKRWIKGGISYSCRITGNISQIYTKDKELKKILGKNKFTQEKYNSKTNENFKYETTEYIGFAPLKEKKFIGKKEVYDIQVEKYHNFIANGIITHNSFIYVPKDVKVDLPLQSYFRMNAQRGGQFEHTLIILDENAELHYIEGCSSPNYTTNALHAGCVELFLFPGSKMRYSSIENWSKNVYNLNTKRALVHKNAKIEWVTGNMGSHTAMVYPSSILIGENAKSESLGIAFASTNQNQDIGAKAIHLAPNTTSIIKSKSISKAGGVTSYRGQVKISEKAKNSKSSVKCDALIIDSKSISNTYPDMKLSNNTSEISHEATVGKIGEDQIFYLMSRGLSEEQAIQLIVSGFISPIVKALPLEYALELNKFIELEMEGL